MDPHQTFLIREAIRRYGILEAMHRYPELNWDPQSIKQALDPQPVVDPHRAFLMREAIGRYGIKEAMLKYPNWNWDSQSINQVLDPQPVSEQQFFLGADLRREERLQKKRNFEILVFVTVAVYATAALFLCFAPPTRMNVGLMGLLLAPTLLLLLGLGIISYVQSRPSSGIAKARRGGAAYVFVFLIIPFLLAEMFGAFAILQGRGHPEESFFYSWFRKADIEWRCVSCGKRFLVGTSTISATCPYCHASNTSVGNR